MTRGRLRGQDDGQILPLVALFLVILAAVMVLVIDVARVYIAQEQLQNAVNASALAAGQQMPNSANAYSQAIAFDAMPNEKNALFGYDVTASAPTVTFECLSHGTDYNPPTASNGPPSCPADSSTTASGSSNDCEPPGDTSPPLPAGTTPAVTTCNAVVVTERATVSSIFGGLFFPHGWGVTATAIAAARGGVPHPLNAVVILDNSGSMEDACSGATIPEGNGNNVPSPTKLDCAKAGVRALLQALDPCSTQLTTCPAATVANSGGVLGSNVPTPVDEIGLEVTPGLASNPVSSGTPPNASLLDEQNCNSSSTFADEYPPWTDYTYSATGANEGLPTSDEFGGYQVVGLSSDYRDSDNSTTGLNLATYSSGGITYPSSPVVGAVDWNACSSGNYPTSHPNTGGYGLKIIDAKASYLAGAITEAQYLLQQAPARTPAATNVIIVESDGDLDAPGSDGAYWTTPTLPHTGTPTMAEYEAYDAFNDSCLSAIEAADAAKAAGTDIYAIQYDPSSASNPSTAPPGCADTSDPSSASQASTYGVPSYVPLPMASGTQIDGEYSNSNGNTYGDVQTMADIASGPDYYFYQPLASDLTADFSQVGTDLTDSRLIPNCAVGSVNGAC